MHWTVTNRTFKQILTVSLALVAFLLNSIFGDAFVVTPLAGASSILLK